MSRQHARNWLLAFYVFVPEQQSAVSSEQRNGLCGCRPFCKRFLTFLVSDRVRTSVRPLFAVQRPLAGMVICGLDPIPIPSW